jgi:hypothetical protein
MHFQNRDNKPAIFQHYIWHPITNKLNSLNCWYYAVVYKNLVPDWWFAFPFSQFYIKSPALTVPPLSHRTSCKPIKPCWFPGYYCKWTWPIQAPYTPCAKCLVFVQLLRSSPVSTRRGFCTRLTESTSKFRLDFTASQYESCILHRRRCDKPLLCREFSSHLPHKDWSPEKRDLIGS